MGILDNLSSLWTGSSSPTPITKPPADRNLVTSLNPQGLKPCCACPETKRARDECYMQTEPSVADNKCKKLVAAHVKCMRGYGFEI